jgi:phenylalanine-4-hydroxylase
MTINRDEFMKQLKKLKKRLDQPDMRNMSEPQCRHYLCEDPEYKDFMDKYDHIFKKLHKREGMAMLAMWIDYAFGMTEGEIDRISGEKLLGRVNALVSMPKELLENNPAMNPDYEAPEDLVVPDIKINEIGNEWLQQMQGEH